MYIHRINQLNIEVNSYRHSKTNYQQKTTPVYNQDHPRTISQQNESVRMSGSEWVTHQQL